LHSAVFTSFPYTTLFRSRSNYGFYTQLQCFFGRVRGTVRVVYLDNSELVPDAARRVRITEQRGAERDMERTARDELEGILSGGKDRKSTRLNSSHEWISY